MRKFSRFTQTPPPKPTPYSSEKIIKIVPLKALYIPIPKVACSSVKRAIANLLTIEIPLDGADIHRANFPVVDRSELHKYDNYWKFCFVRNPWDRLVSCYSEKIKPDKNFFGTTNSFSHGVHKGLLKYGVFEANMPFDEFLKAVSSIPDHEADQHFRSQHTFLTDKNGNLITDFIGRFESISQDFNEVFSKLGEPEIELPKSNKTHHQEYRQHYTDDLLSIFEKRYSKDIELFGYHF
ncbi:MAG: sulfotransferase family 2 domain-containing protein [Cyanobacteria bacterium J06635_15]